MPMRPRASWSEIASAAGENVSSHAYDALLHVAEEQEGQVGAAIEEDQADRDPGAALGRDVEHRHEQAEEEQGGAEVLLEDEDPEARCPGDEDRSEVAGAREREPEDLAPGQRQDVAGLHEVAGEEHRQRDLGDLTRLERERPRPIQIREP